MSRQATEDGQRDLCIAEFTVFTRSLHFLNDRFQWILMGGTVENG